MFSSFQHTMHDFSFCRLYCKFFFFNKSGYTTDFIEIKNHTILKRQGYQTSGTKTVNI
jgi:hypothetical protein